MRIFLSFRASFLLLFFIGTVTMPLLAEDSIQAKWTTTASLASGRTYCSATLLPDGRVLVAGGYGDSGDLASAEMYDPTQGTFTQTAPMAHGRSALTATLLPNGKVLVAGGQSAGATLTSSELYDPSTGSWTPTGNLHIARSYHTATLLGDGQVLVVGGSHWASPPVFAQGVPAGSALDVAELYDPSTGKWTVADSLHTPRYLHTATLLEDGDVLVAAGRDPGKIGRAFPDGPDERKVQDGSARGEAMPGDAISSAELFDHKTKTWSVTGSLSLARFNHTATLLPNGQVLVAGGQNSGNVNTSAEVYDASIGKWTATGNLQVPRNGQTATLMADRDVLVTGGADNSEVLSSAEMYHPSTGTWEKIARMNATHSLHTATLLKSGRLLLAGGGYALGDPRFLQGSSELCEIASAPSPTLVSTGVTTPIPAPISPAPTDVDSPPAPLLTAASILVVFTLCIVIITGCVVVILASCLVFVLARRWCK